MKLSAKSEYACLAMIHLSNVYKEKKFIRIQEIATKMDIPKKFLEQILLALKGGGYVNSRKGADGGYRLARNPKSINLAEIVRLMDGALAPVSSVSKYFYESTPIEKSKHLMSVFKDIRNYISKKMEKTTFADLVS